jgi:hypothetical protein
MQLFLPVWVIEHVAEFGVGGEEMSQVLMLRLTPSIEARTSKLKQSSVRSEVTFSWIDRIGWIHEGTSEIKTIMLRVNQHR